MGTDMSLSHHLPQEEDVIAKIMLLYEQISALNSLQPSETVNTLFTNLVLTCIPPSSIDVTHLPPSLHSMRSHLIRLSATAETLLEFHFSAVISSHSHPLAHLHLFPYLSNYIKLSHLEHKLLSHHLHPGRIPSRIAFIGSGPLPLSSVVLALRHFPGAMFHNYDVNPAANTAARDLVSGDPDLSGRMVFHDADIMDVSEAEMREYDVVFLAALVGMEPEEKGRVVERLGKGMGHGAALVVRSAHGARGFLYPVVEEREVGRWFEVVAVHHPSDEVINSVVVGRKKVEFGACGAGKGMGGHVCGMEEEMAMEHKEEIAISG